MSDRQRLTASAWLVAALEQIATGGSDSVTVEGLARHLGVTKGSFYWHFADRADLIDRAVSYWAQESTDGVIAELGPITDPVERLRKLLEVSFGDDRGGLDVVLATSVDEPAIRSVVERVTASRLDFLSAIFRDIGEDSVAAERRAVITYAMYLGHFGVARAGGERAMSQQRDPGYVDHLLATLLP